jgi:hypothetical protein
MELSDGTRIPVNLHFNFKLVKACFIFTSFAQLI